MNRKQTPDWLTNLMTIVLIAMVLLLAAWLIGRFVPGVDVAILAFIEAKWPSLAKFLREQGWAPSILIAVVMALIAAWIGFRKAMKAGASLVYRGLRYGIHRLRTATPIPSNCVPLSEILHNKLKLPEEDLGTQSLELLGRTDELDWLKRQAQAARSPAASAVRVVQLWGPQGIGKTHLAFRFATGLSKREYRECGRWHAWSLDREFDARALADSLPKTATVLLWDDISLDDDASHRRLRDLLSECVGRKQPLLVVLSGWRPRLAGALTRDQALVDAEREVGPLDPDNARSLYASAADLPEAERGHPLLLRLLSRQAASAANAPMSTDLWDSCQQWAGEFAQRLESKYALGPAARQALAVVSSSEACAWPQVQAAFGLSDNDHRALEKTGRLRNRQGAVWLEPVRPDLLGWAYALHALATISLQDAERWAVHAWTSGFFDTERFLRHAMTHQQQAHVWALALRAPRLEDEDVAVARAKAVVNAVNRYGIEGDLEAVMIESAVAQTISENFPYHIEIQMRRIMAAANAVNHGGAADKWEVMEAELNVVREIAARFPGDVEIQHALAMAMLNAFVHYSDAGKEVVAEMHLSTLHAIADRFAAHIGIQHLRAQGAISAVRSYGSVRKLEAMTSELIVVNAIAGRFPKDVEIRLAQAKIVANAVHYYGDAEQWEQMASQLNLVQEIAEQFHAEVDIQLARARAATNAMYYYNRIGRGAAMTAEKVIVNEISAHFSEHVEIQLARAKAAAIASDRYFSEENWEAMAAQFVAMQAIAMRFPDAIEIQRCLALALFSSAQSFRAAGLHAESEAQVDALIAQLQIHPQLQRMSPFDRLLRGGVETSPDSEMGSG